MTIPCDSGGKAEETKTWENEMENNAGVMRSRKRGPGPKLRPYTDLSMPNHADMTFQQAECVECVDKDDRRACRLR